MEDHHDQKSLSPGVGSKSEAFLKTCSQCEAKLVDSSPYHNFQGECEDSSSAEPEDNYEDRDNDMNRREDCTSPIYLTNDLLHIVFSFLDMQMLCSTALVCHQWNYISNHDEFWTCLDFEKYKNISAEQAIRLCRKHPSAKELNLYNQLYDEHTVHEAILTLPGLEKLTLCGDMFKDDVLTVVNECRALKYLVLKDAILSEEIEINHDKVCHLEFVRCEVPLIEISCPELHCLSVMDSNMETTDLNCPRLHRLDLSLCFQISKEVICEVVKSFPSLKELRISHCNHVTNAMLREISSVCINLSSLDVSVCQKISLEGVSLTRLTKLTLKYCKRINKSSIMTLSNCIRLESIEFEYCPFLKSLILDARYLRNISISNCCEFTSLNLTCPSLENLSVQCCRNLTCVHITSASLEKFLLSNASEGPSQFTGCPKIQTLTLENCKSLKYVKMITGSLRALKIAGCIKLENLDLQCPRLRDFAIQMS